MQEWEHHAQHRNNSLKGSKIRAPLFIPPSISNAQLQTMVSDQHEHPASHPWHHNYVGSVNTLESGSLPPPNLPVVEGG